MPCYFGSPPIAAAIVSLTKLANRLKHPLHHFPTPDRVRRQGHLHPYLQWLMPWNHAYTQRASYWRDPHGCRKLARWLPSESPKWPMHLGEL
jgi:hypothetical protein